jgi:23S rRNA (cytosine1962-C5)-methyltransferase
MHPYVTKLSTLIRAAEARQRGALDGRAIDAYRLIRGIADGAPAELTVDRYLEYVVVTHRDSLLESEGTAWCAAAEAALSPKAVVLKTMAKTPQESGSRVVFGVAPSEPLRVREGDAVFLCELDDGVQTGLFLDHQETRFEARAWAKDVEVLNLFAYTCAFSVHAALAGAVRVTSVDVNKRALDRGRTNMRESGLDPDRHRWFTDDVLEHLERKSPAYGLIILDPPVFGRSKKRSFSLARELDRLIAASLAKLTDDGLLMFSTHSTQLTMEALRAQIPARVVRTREEGSLKILLLKK